MYTKYLSKLINCTPGSPQYLLYLSILSKLCGLADNTYSVGDVITWATLEERDGTYNKAAKECLKELRSDIMPTIRHTEVRL